MFRGVLTRVVKVAPSGNGLPSPANAGIDSWAEKSRDKAITIFLVLISFCLTSLTKTHVRIRTLSFHKAKSARIRNITVTAVLMHRMDHRSLRLQGLE